MKFIKYIFRGYILFKGNSKSNSIALTFDDGPHAVHTKDILSILKKENVKATFFVVGREAEKYPELLKKISEEGHQIGNHSYSHKKSGKGCISEVEKSGKIIREIIGNVPKIYRPPWGKVGIGLLLYSIFKNNRMVLWSFDSKDYIIKDADELKNFCKNSKIESGDIILLHEDYDHTKKALQDIIFNLKQRGFNFKTISEIEK